MAGQDGLQARRGFLTRVGAVGLGLAAAATGGRSARGQQDAPDAVAATQALMHEHGVIHRLMNVYQECADRLIAGVDVPPDALGGTGVVLDDFIRAHHEAIEEQYVYPAFIAADRRVGTVAVLIRQHAVGRSLAARVVFLAGKDAAGQRETRNALVRTCRAYARMYRAHVAHEDTVLLPALREVMPAADFSRLSERFRASERGPGGQNPAASALERIVEAEEMLGIAGLDAFTAQLQGNP